ncbi:MauE/DoxX family redox-associated membrane protein [Stackebrandtia endophytica]|uniref:MauE/DoxX family redox-associated membrane protein n=1 Tax=Stackebrandtia endophytica TaxID=1496996 RepID=UPI00114F499D|nr:MauE/DoxX family redox-associated membrane protein [Stackebrandtia endophytica]
MQAPLVGVVLLWSASVKLFTRRGRLRSQTTALSKLLGEQRAALAYRGLGGIEALLGLALLTPPLWWPKPAAVIVMAIGFAGYLTYARIHAPESSCGCMSATHVPISWRGYSRAGWLLAAGILGLFANQFWFTALTGEPVVLAAVMVGEAVLFIALSPEFDGAWLVPLRRLRVAVTDPLGGDNDSIPLDATVTRLHHSDLYRHVAPALRTDVHEHWDEDEYRFITYGAEYDGSKATAVFAVPLRSDAPEPIRVALVNEETGETLIQLDHAPEEAETPEWALSRGSTPAGSTVG